ncbi:MAG: 8-amino-7-oxononanoate synthase [Hyphomicrobiaceae bacterium]|jgi:8-amino-7-oxononanoate synthase
MPDSKPIATIAASSSTASGQDRQGRQGRQGLDRALSAELQSIQDAGLLRSLRRVEGRQSVSVGLGGRDTLLLCSNNYLGLADDPRVVAAAVNAAQTYGSSAVSSRLVSGHMAIHADTEATIAAWKGTEAALLFSTGYQANLGVLTTLVGPGDVIVSDELNHASIIDGCRLARAHTAVYRHNDVEHLRTVLAAHGDARRILVVTESVFSMDGDRAPLSDIADACEEVGAWLVVDEAHAVGIFGKQGAGLVSELGLNERVHATIGTLGKALASFGAYVAGSRTLIDLLVNRARTLIFTTGLPPSAVAAAREAIEICKQEPGRRTGLIERASALGLALRNDGLDVPHIESQILPIVIGDTRRAVAVANQLLEQGIYVAAIRPPTVPQGTSRLRLSLMATHTPEQIERARGALVQAIAAPG